MIDRDQAGRTPLHYAAADGDTAQARALLAMGASPDKSDSAGWTPLHFAAQSHAVEIATMLLEAGASVDPRDNDGNTPLFRAVFASRGRGEMIALLRNRGADPMSVNQAGQSPVGVARLIGNYDVAQHLGISAQLPNDR